MDSFALSLRDRLPWPLPALLAWAGAWLVWKAALAVGLPAELALACGSAAGVAGAWINPGHWRRAIAALGFPLVMLALGAAANWPAWVWLLALAPLLLLYPMRAWRDAPLFPTPQAALQGLKDTLGGPAPQRILDAGCGLGHGLRALRGQWPGAELTGIEYSRALALASRWRCRFATIRYGDIWAADWSGFDLVYLFQRPESMPRAWAQAQAQLKPGAWLVSLEFEVPGATPFAVLRDGHRRALWVYRPAPPADSIGAPACR